MASTGLDRMIAGLYWVLRLALGASLIAAGIAKGLDLGGYVEILRTYQTGLGSGALWFAAATITVFELLLGLWLVSGIRTPAAAAVSAALHTFYFAILTMTLLRGVNVPNCGCFGVYLGRPLQPSTLVEDLVLVGISVVLFALARRRERRCAELVGRQG